MAGGALVHLWNTWGIQILVLLSFTFQVFLLVFAGIRRRKASFVLMLLLWLVYLLADSTAIYALGHLSVTGSSQEHQLVAFWAPFLLVHLGGPDTITAYSLEDSRLWLRHMLTLVVQALGAAYVLYMYIPGTGTLLQLASMCVFVVGILKYAERTWALKCGGTGDLRRRADKWGTVYLNSITREKVWSHLRDGRDNEEELLIGAYLLFFLCIHLFAGMIITSSDFDVSQLVLPKDEDMYRLVEMELSLVYDTMYTKARVIHTWYGYSVRVISLVSTIAAALLFHLSDTNKQGFSRVDIAITYVLLVGAVVLETLSVFRAIGSTWMCAWLYRMRREWLLDVLKSLRRRVQASKKRKWPGSIGQHNLLHLCTHDRTELGSTLASTMGLEGWWGRVHFVGTTNISETDLRELLLDMLPKTDGRNSRGVHMLQSMGLDKEHAEWSHWSINMINFDQSILIWHIATDVYLGKSKVGHEGKLTEAVKVLSNYMMFLLVAKPEMLPGLVRHGLYVETCKKLYFAWYMCSADQNNQETVVSPKTRWEMLKELFHHDGPSGSRIPEREQLACFLHSTSLGEYGGEWKYSPADDGKSLGACVYRRADDHAREVAAELLGMESSRPGLLGVIFGVWVEMLCYAANHCSPDSHARQLSSGGEFITVVWLLIHHLRKTED